MTVAYTIRQCARDIVAVLEKLGPTDEFAEQAIPFVKRLMERPDLLTLGVERQAIHADASIWLYYDYDLHIHISPFMKVGTSIPIHNHSVWEMVGLYRGGADHTLYARTDDASRVGHAELEVLAHANMRQGDVVFAVPPLRDIHTFTIDEPETYFLTVVGGHFNPVRTYYDAERETYIERPSAGYRKARGLS